MAYRTNVSKIISGVGGVASEATKDVKAKAYRLAGKIERQVDEEQGIPGGIAKLVKETAKTGQETHAKIQEQGGYLKGAERVANHIGTTLEQVYKQMERTTDRFYQSITTNGEYDPEKARALLNDRAQAVKRFGEKAISNLADVVENDIRLPWAEDYRKQIPTPEELRTTYAGIGTDYQGALDRNNYEACIAFRGRVEKLVHPGIRINGQAAKPAIIADINRSAASSPQDLVDYYRKKGDSTGDLKLQKLARYQV